MIFARIVLFAVLAFSLSGCSQLWSANGEGVAAQTLPYRASLQRGEDRRDFTVTVRAPGATVGQVRESVRFQATRYCLPTYGSSEAEWSLDQSTDDWAFARAGENMVFTGRCIAR